MTNVHSKVRAVMNRADKIKPKDFFLNKIFRLHLEDMATNITKRYRGKRKVKVVVDWDTKDGATIAVTNNFSVYLNAGVKFLHTNDLKLLYKRVLGLFAHELGHVLWTDFVANMSYNNGLEQGVWFPRKPRLVNYDMQINEQNFWDLALQSSEVKGLLIKYINELNNILEDGFIEEQIFRTYPGILGTGLKETRDAHWEVMPELSRMIEEEDNVDEDLNKHKLFTMFALLLQYAKYGEVKCDGVPVTDEHLVMLGKLMPVVDEFMQSPPRERFALTSEVALIIFPWLKDFIEKFLEQDNQNGSGSGGNGSGSSNQNSQGQGQGGSGQPQMSPNQANALSNMLQQNIQSMPGNSQQGQGNSNAVAPVQSNANSNTQATKNRQKTQSQIPSSNEFQIAPNSSNGSGNENGDEENNAGGNSGSGSDEEENNPNNTASGNGDSDGDEEESGSASSGDEGDEGDEESGSAGSDGDDSGDGDDGNAIQNTRGDSKGEDTGKNFDGEGQNIGYGEGACEDGDSSEETDYNNEYEAQIDANIEKKLDSLLEEMRVEKAVKTLEGERIRELDEFANNISYGNAHKNIRVRVNRASEITDRMVEAYNEVSPPCLAIAKNLAKKYLQIADNARQGGRLDGLLMGRKFNAAAAYRTDGKVFMKMIMPQQMQPVVVGILLDESGSMSGKRSEVAMATAIIIQNFCEQLGIPVAIYGHSTGSYECELYSYIEFDTYSKKDKYRLTDIGARNCNRDGAALRFLAERLMTRPEEAKILMLVSDGQPNGADGYYGAKAEADLRGIQKEYTKKGICFCAAAIGDDKQVIKNIYGDAFLDISDLNQLPTKLIKVLEKYLKVI